MSGNSIGGHPKDTGGICILTEWPLRAGWELDFLKSRLASFGVSPSEITWLSIIPERAKEGLIHKTPAVALTVACDFLSTEFSRLQPNVTLALGEYCSQFLAGITGIDKWQASVLPGKFGGKVIPCYPMDRVVKDLSLQVWVSLCAKKAAAERHTPQLKEITYEFLLNPSLEETLAYLSSMESSSGPIAVDIETGRGQINTVGFALSPTQAIAINTLPERLSACHFKELWEAIRKVLESDHPKILQNYIYEQLYFSRYGISLRGVAHDTMIAQKVLWPEFEMGLDSVGRMYTDMPYWKDDGKSWNNIRDWQAHYLYNCKDTAGTFAGYLGQKADLSARGLSEFYYGYISRLFPAAAEMCSWGIPLSEQRLKVLRDQVGGEYDSTLAELRGVAGAETLNPRSPAQVKSFLVSRGYALPKKYDSKTKQYKESTDEKSLKKLRLKAPDDLTLSYLLRLAKLGKALSSYLSFTYHEDKRMRFSLNVCGTETGRWAGHCDPWDNGVNPQTLPGGNKGINIKSIFEASPGMTFLQCDLRQAESRFVAYDSADLNLIQTLEDTARDIHWEVACEILRTLGKEIPEKKSADGKFWRQLGKKSGHGANYSMKEATFIDSCIGEMDIVLSKKEATAILEAYHSLYPGIRMWHASLRKELCQTRKLKTPLGRERYFYGRMDDDTFRQAYAYRPQSTIPDVTNHMMLFLMECRKQKLTDFRLLLQCHDSILLEVPKGEEAKISALCSDTSKWHPRITLAGGQLIIPTEVEVGNNLGGLIKWHA